MTLLHCPNHQFWAIGYPSKTVVKDDGVPGTPIRIAEIRPPEQPPTNIPMNEANAWMEVMVNVKGIARVRAMEPESPGTQPNIKPTTDPANNRKNDKGSNCENPMAIELNKAHPLKFLESKRTFGKFETESQHEQEIG